MTDSPLTPPADTKDWTWVLEAPCPACGFVSAAWDVTGLIGLIRGTVAGYQAALARDDARQRPEPQTWSPLEYSAHVRDVHRTCSERMRLMLTQENPTFPNWNQDDTALAERYDLQDPAVVSRELAEIAEQTARVYETITPADLGRSGLRSNGSEFTVLTLGQYHLHDVVHHLVDLGASVDDLLSPQRIGG